MKYAIFLLALACAPAALNAELLHKAQFQPEAGAPSMETNIALVGSKTRLGELEKKANLAIVDPTGMLDSAYNATNGDIEEDPSDRFITSRTGKLRPRLVEDSGEWAEEGLVVDSRQEPKSLSRKKRCGDGDGGDARRARRARARRIRRQRARAARRAARTAAKSQTSTTTVTRKVIQNGQVVSQTTETQGAAAAAVATQPAQVIVQHQPAAPVVQAVQPAQPVIVQQQPAAQQAAAVAGLPSIAVTGSVKVN